MNTELLARVQHIDPASSVDSVPDEVWDAQQVLAEIQRRTNTPVPRRLKPNRPWLIAAAVATAILVVIGGLGVLTRVQNDTDAPPVLGQVESEEPTVVEPVVQAGTLATPSGDASWVRVSSEDGTLPGWGKAMAWPSGFAIFQQPSASAPPSVFHSAQLWVSDNGIEWRVEPLPLDPGAQAANLFEVDGVYWLMSFNPGGLWRSTDGATWDEYDPTALLPSGPGGLFSPIGSSLVSAGGLTLGYLEFEADFPFHDYLPLLIEDYSSDRDEGCRTFRKLEAGVFQIVGHQGDQPCPHQLTLRFEETETGLRVLDNTTGVGLGEILGGDVSHIEQLTQGDNFFEERLVLIADNVISPVELPWPARLPTEGLRVWALFDAQDWIYAYVRDDTGQVSVWRTSDGRSWTDLGPPGFPDDAPPADSLWFTSFYGPLMALDTNSSPSTAWETTDGVNWSPAPSGRPESTTPLILESVWFANNGSQGGTFDGDAWWMHVGDTWIPLTELGIEGRCAGATAAAVDNTTFFFGRDCPDIWILSFDPSS